MATVLLISGAFHGGWCWQDCRALLEEKGHRVLTPSLTGLAERKGELSADTDLAQHIEDIVSLLEEEDLQNVVLVGHSYAGMPMTGAADRAADRLAALVYVDAYVPEDGDSAWQLRNSAPGAAPFQSPEGATELSVPPPEIFGLEGELAAQAKPLLTPHPLKTMTDVIHLSGKWRQVAVKHYLRFTGYPAPQFDQAYQRLKDDPAWHCLSMDVIHNYFMTEPGWFADYLQQIIESLEN